MTFADQEPSADDNPFFLEENGQAILPYVPASYLCVNSAKILDGVFIGNKDAAVDLEFITSNKITHIINCVGHLVPNSLMRYGIQYLTFQWIDAKTTVMFDPEGQNLHRLMSFIHSAIQNHGGILIFSVYGKSRCCCVAAAFLMQQFGWSLQKALEFIQFKRPDISPKPYYLRQLKRIEKCTSTKSGGDGTCSRWLDDCDSNCELVARNTFLNGHYIKTETELGQDSFNIYEDFESSAPTRPASSRLRWMDQVDASLSLELSPGVEYSARSQMASASSNGPIPILKNSRPPTPTSPNPSKPVGELAALASAKLDLEPARPVRSAWNNSLESASATLTRTFSARPSSAQSEHEDQQAQNLAGGLMWRQKPSRFESDDDKYRKSTLRSSSVMNAATVSSLAKVKRSAVKFRSPSATTKSSSTPPSTHARRSRSRSSSSTGTTPNWLSKFGSMSLIGNDSKPVHIGSSGFSLHVHGRRPTSAGSAKTRTY